ncbi:hypothetical protein IPM09_03115 [Candidatus Saccharibacteria bacterium]|nr:MAG: hypothetical protein IPM09_03115 [Candidatus Saccharibacteria bacterium]
MNQQENTSTQALRQGTTGYAWMVVLISLAWTATAVALYLLTVTRTLWYLPIMIVVGVLAARLTRTVTAADRCYRDALEAAQRQEKYGVVEPLPLDHKWEARMDYLRDMSVGRMERH